MKEFLNHAADQYYNGTPIISDAEFDKLAQIHNYSSVGYSVTAVSYTHLTLPTKRIV